MATEKTTTLLLAFIKEMQADRKKYEERKIQEEELRSEERRREQEQRKLEETRKETDRMDDERRRDKEWGDLLEKFATITASSGVVVADHAGKAESRSRDADKIPKLRNLKKEEDEEAYFNAFEAHMDSYAVGQRIMG